MGAGLRRAVNATRATRGVAPLERFAVYHKATVRPFSASLEISDLSEKDAISEAIEIQKDRGGRVEVVNAKHRTVWSLGEPGPDEE